MVKITVYKVASLMSCLAQPVIALYARADERKVVVSALLKQLALLARMLAGSECEVVLEQIAVETDSKLDFDSIERWRKARAIVVLAVTPSLLLSKNLLGDGMQILVRLSERNSLRVLPIYCLPVAEPASTPFAELLWFPANLQDRYRSLLDLGTTPSRAAAKAADYLGSAIKTTSRLQGSAHCRPRIDDIDLGCAENSSLGVIVCDYDQILVGQRLSTTFETLERDSGFRVYRPWDRPMGSSILRQRALAVRSQNVVVFLSAEALADDCFYEQIMSLTPQQKVTLVLLSSCAWEILEFEQVNFEIIPKMNSKVVPLDLIKPTADAWLIVARYVLRLFAKQSGGC